MPRSAISKDKRIVSAIAIDKRTGDPGAGLQSTADLRLSWTYRSPQESQDQTSIRADRVGLLATVGSSSYSEHKVTKLFLSEPKGRPPTPDYPGFCLRNAATFIPVGPREANVRTWDTFLVKLHRLACGNMLCRPLYMATLSLHSSPGPSPPVCALQNGSL